MSTIAHDADNFVAPAEVPEMELYHNVATTLCVATLWLTKKTTLRHG